MAIDYVQIAKVRAAKGNTANTNPNAGKTYSRTPTTKTTYSSYTKRKKNGVHARGGGDVRRKVMASGGSRQMTQAEIAANRARIAALRKSRIGTPILPPAIQLPSTTTLPGRRTIKVSEPSWFFGWTDVPKWTVTPHNTYGSIKVYADSEGNSWASNKGDKYYVHPDGSILIKRASGGKLQYYAEGFTSKGAYGVTVSKMPTKFA